MVPGPYRWSCGDPEEVDRMTLKQTITDELLNSVADPGELEEVVRKYSRSKGPFYAALAEATSQLLNRLGKLQQQTTATEERQSSLDQQVESLVGQIVRIEKRIQERRPKVEQADAMLKGVQELLDQADTLKKAGLGEKELSRLHQLLAQIVAKQGLHPQEGVVQFFETVASYEQVVSLDLETKRAEVRAASAKSEAERWQAEAQTREARTKARVSSIDLLEKLLSQGVRAQDLPHWQAVLTQAGVTAENLSGSLEKYGSLEAFTSQKREQAKELAKQAGKLEIQVKALTEQRDNAKTAVEAVREHALTKVEQAGQQLAKEMKEAGELAQTLIEDIAVCGINYGNLRSEHADLLEYIQVAEILKSADPERWQLLPRDTIQRLLLGVALWAQAEGRDPKLPPPGAIRGRTLIPSYCEISVADALIWAMSGVFTEEERQALGAAR